MKAPNNFPNAWDKAFLGFYLALVAILWLSVIYDICGWAFQA